MWRFPGRLLLICQKHGLLPSSLTKEFEEKAPNFHKWSEAVVASPSVTEIFDEQANLIRTKERIAKARA
jgi:glutathione S-transferase